MAVILGAVLACVPLLIAPGSLFYFDVTPKAGVLLPGVAAALPWFAARGARILSGFPAGRWLCALLALGSLPTTDGTAATAQAGCLIMLDNIGQPVATLAGNGINGPWDMTALDMDSSALLFVANVLNGTIAANGAVVSQGTVLRIPLSIPMSGAPTAGPFVTIASALRGAH